LQQDIDVDLKIKNNWELLDKSLAELNKDFKEDKDEKEEEPELKLRDNKFIKKNIDNVINFKNHTIFA
jgi:hypothetical protein